MLTFLLYRVSAGTSERRPIRELVQTERNENDRPGGRSQINAIAGAGLIPNPATVEAPEAKAIAHRVEESCLLGEPVSP